MGTIVQFRLLVLDSLKYSSKTESPINKSTKAVISRNLTTSQHNHLSIYLFFFYLFVCLLIIRLFYFILFYFIFFLSFLSFLFYFSYIYRKQSLASYLHSDSNRCYWLA